MSTETTNGTVKVVPQGASGVGNTTTTPRKRVNPAKRWCFTLNNYTDIDIGAIKDMYKAFARYGVYGLEVGTKGTPHVQGYVEFKKKVRPIGLLTKKVHWELARGKRWHNVQYCTKDCDGYYFPPKYNITIELYDWQRKCVDILSKDPDERSIYWIWEPEGCAGKTVFQKYLFTTLKKDIVIVSGKAMDMKYAIVKYLEENGRTPEIVLVNIPKCSGNHLSIAGMESIKDMFFYCGKYEGGMVCGPNPHVMVFANEAPQMEDVLSKDRIKEIYIGQAHSD